MSHLSRLALIMCLSALPALAPALAPAVAQQAGGPVLQTFRPLPFHDLAARVSARYAGRMIAAQSSPPTEFERAMGVQLVYEFRLMTPQRNLLNIRLDARDGRFLTVAGRGQLAARLPASN